MFRPSCVIIGLMKMSLICDNSVTTQWCHNTTLSQHNHVTTKRCHKKAVSQHNTHNTTVSQHNTHNTTVSQHNTHNTAVSQHNGCHNTTVSQHNSVTTQQCHSTTLTTQLSQHNTYNTVSQHNNVTTQQCHSSKCVIFQEKLLKVLKCYNFLWVRQRHNCSAVVSFANCVLTLYVSFYTNNSKMPNFELWHSFCKWAICKGILLVCHYIYHCMDWYVFLQWRYSFITCTEYLLYFNLNYYN